MYWNEEIKQQLMGIACNMYYGKHIKEKRPLTCNFKHRLGNRTVVWIILKCILRKQ